VKLKSVKVEQLKRVLEVLSFLDCEEIEVEDLAKFFII
jgi:predicted type IV restriction endonuclease